MWLRADNPQHRQAAVVDLGSNSVRLVIYRLEGRAIWTVYNEKALAGLGRDLPSTGRLSRDGVEVALAALRRFRTVLEGWKPADVTVVATAAVREGVDGPSFVRRVREETGLEVRVLTGEEEARYAALGVLAGDPTAGGVVGDLGGSSLELIRVDAAGPKEGVSLLVGPFALGAPKPLAIDKTRRAIERELAPVAARFATPRFQAVGGAWRNLALLHMELSNYPLHIAHQYEMSRADALDVARFVERQSSASLERMAGLSKKRIETLPYSALVLEAVVEQLGVDRVCISAYGVREGLLLESMPAEVRRQDPLIAGAVAAAAARGFGPPLGGALEAWLTPLFQQLPPAFGARDATLLAAACHLADLGARLHPDHRADIAFEQVLRAPVAGVTHPERAFLAIAAFARHTAAANPPELETVTRILSPERRTRARALGAALRLGCDLAGRNPSLLEKSGLSLKDGRLVLAAGAGWEDMLLGEQTTKRAMTLAGLLKAKLEVA